MQKNNKILELLLENHYFQYMKISTSIEKYKYKRPDIRKTISARLRILQKLKADRKLLTNKKCQKCRKTTCYKRRILQKNGSH